MNHWRGITGWTLRFSLVASALLVLASCGSGNVPSVSTGPAPVTGPVAVLPGTATLYSETPTTFLVSGGSGSFILVSSDQRVVPVTASFSGGSFTIVPNAVSVDTPVTLTVRDANGTTQASAQLTVKPRTVSGTVTITPSSGQSPACGTAVCAGGDAEVVATFSQGGAPLVGREARFEVVSGDFRIITSAVGSAETLATSAITTTDSTGKARVRIRALSQASSQTALIQITDVSSGSFTRTGFSIAPAASAVLNALPNILSFAGRDASVCASGITAEVIVFGGSPPYTVTRPGAFTVSPTVVTSSGSRFTVTATGQCSSGAQISVIDSAGATTSISVSNVVGPATPASERDLTVGPATLDLGPECASTASAIVVGGQGNYIHQSSSPYLQVDSLVGNYITISRANKWDPLTKRPNTPLVVAVSDGRQVVTLTVNTPETSGNLCSPPVPR